MIKRIFQDIPDGKLDEADQQSFLVNLGWSRATTWVDLLRSRRVMIISEAGAGKTHECRTQAQRLRDEGEPAFFVELAALAKEDLRNLLDDDEEARLEAWLSSQSDVATIFLDSIDELKLSQGSFERALRRLKKGIGSQLRRVRIVITTRPIPFDEQIFRQLLPIPPESSSEPNEETFASIAMGEHLTQREDKDLAPEWRSVALMPLSNEQILEFARAQGVGDPESLLEDLHRRNAQEFARRPQDLIELCADWREHKRIRTHRDQVVSNIRIKLSPRDDRLEAAELSLDKAIEGAARLALAMQMTRRLTIRHNAASDVSGGEAALDPASILSDWQPNERKALLERPLFGFASYGRVRFHHRSVAEYLAAERLVALLDRGMSFRALRRLLFATTKGKTIVRPSKRPVAGWLALKDEGIFELLRDNEPAVLLNEGDPESLTQTQRNQALQAYSDRYGPGGRRGLSVPHIQVHRFASKGLAGVINNIWKGGVENPDVREFLVNSIEEGRIEACVDIVFNTCRNEKASATERVLSLDALVSLNDKRLYDIAHSIAISDGLWPDRVAIGAVIRLFPKYLSTEHLCQILKRVRLKEHGLDRLCRQLPRLIAMSELDLPTLERLRDGLVGLVSEGLRFQKEWPHIISDRVHLNSALAATCVRGLSHSLSDEWLYACVLALRLHCRDHDDESVKSLQQWLADLSASDNARLFWTDDTLLQFLCEVKDPRTRYAEIAFHDGPVRLRSDRDLPWISAALGDTTHDVSERALLLEAAIRLKPAQETWAEHVARLKPLVVDTPSLTERVIALLRPSKNDAEHLRWEKLEAKRKKQQKLRKAKAHASWIHFSRTIATQLEDVFTSERGRNTAWNLWLAMRKGGDDSRSPRWNRRFIEHFFNRETADKFRHFLMKVWRDDCPTLPSERPVGERNSYSQKWELGLVAIYAEAEDADWAKKLSDGEARLAARYAPLALNGLPLWIEDLVETHQSAVDQTLGNELSWELCQAPGECGLSFLLQTIDHASTNVAKIFLPRLNSWLDTGVDRGYDADNKAGMAQRVRQVTGFILKHGDEAAIAHLLEITRQRLGEKLRLEMRHEWLPVLMRIDPESGLAELEEQVSAIEPAALSEAVGWFAILFGDRWGAVSLNQGKFTPHLLLRLLRLAYYHVRTEDDAHHQGAYTPNTRDDAEHGRNAIVSALLNAKGEEGWAAKLEMAADPLCEHFKDRIRAVAEENWAEEIDAEVLDEVQAVALDRSGEAPPLTNGGMFSILKDRLDDLDDLLLRDYSPRELWAGITDEKVMRRAIARELSCAANSIYTVDQEGVTADEKETDIRLRSVASSHEAVIELKLGDNRTAKDLRDTIENQLVKKYMASSKSKSGALLITLASDRKWHHPDQRRLINVDELFSLLRDEAERVQEALGGDIAIYIHFLDLRPRLPLENNS